MDYPNVPLTMYRVSFDMVRRHTNGKHRKIFSVTFPAVNEEKAREAVHDFCWGINEASNHLYLTPQNQYVKVEELMWSE